MINGRGTGNNPQASDARHHEVFAAGPQIPFALNHSVLRALATFGIGSIKRLEINAAAISTVMIRADYGGDCGT